MLSFQAAVYADFNSNGFPCVKDLCVGDGEDKLIKLSWQPLEGNVGRDEAIKAVKQLPLYQDMYNNFAVRQKLIGKKYSIDDIILSLLSRRFDSKSLEALAETTVCEHIQLTGEFKSESGFPTIVTIDSTTGTTKTGEYASGLVVTKIERLYQNQNADVIQSALTREFPKLKVSPKFNEDGFAVFRPRGSRDVYSSPTLMLHAAEFTNTDFEKVPLCKMEKNNTKIE